MNTFYILAGAAIIIAVGFIISDLMSRYCSACGTRMDKSYDPEEDAEVYQCPKCGRSYIIK